MLARQERVRHAWGKIQRASGLHSAELWATEVVEVLSETSNGRSVLQKRNVDFSVANGRE